jgi:hypothetical protein
MGAIDSPVSVSAKKGTRCKLGSEESYIVAQKCSYWLRGGLALCTHFPKCADGKVINLEARLRLRQRRSNGRQRRL